MNHWILPIAIIPLMAACTKPLDLELPLDGRLTASQAQNISAKLDPADRELFMRWHQRMQENVLFGGEPIARTVQRAIVNQQQFEAEQNRIAIAEQERLAQIEEEKTRSAQLENEIARRRLAVHDKIAKYFKASIDSYTPTSYYDRYDRVNGGVIVFKLRFTNLSSVPVLGIAGVISISDVFGQNLGDYPFRFDPRIEPGESIIYDATLDFDPRNESHQAIWKASRLNANWFFVSAAYSGGFRIDYENIGDVRELPMFAPAKTRRF